MAKSTGPVLAIGGITIANEYLLNNEPFPTKVAIATAVAVGLFALGEKAFGQPIVTLAYLAMTAALFVRVNPNVPTPIESAQRVWKEIT